MRPPQVRSPTGRLAVLVLLASALGGCSPDPTASPTGPGSSPAATRVRVSDLPVGPPPRVPYVDGYAYVAPGGRRVELPRGRGVTSVRPFRDGFLVADARNFEASNGLAYVDAQGRRTDLGPCVSGGAELSDDGRWAAWATFGCPESTLTGPLVVHRAATSGTREDRQRLDTRNRSMVTSVAGLLGGDVVVSRGFVDGVLVTDLHSRPTRLPLLEHAEEVHAAAALVAGGVGDYGGAVVDARSGTVLWRNGFFRAADFNRDGSRLVGYGRRARLLVLDARTGRLLRSIRPPRGLVAYDVRWEDGRHLLGVAHQGDREAVVRIGLDGSFEQATRLARPVDEASLGRYVLDAD